jgi:hypothetical protein
LTIALGHADFNDTPAELHRNPAALANLPEPERQTWQAFWHQVEGLLREGICP